MGREVRLFKSEEPKTRTEVSEFLRMLADKLDAGKVTLHQGQQNISLELPQNLILEIQVEDEDKGNRGTQHSLEVEIKWFDNGSSGPLTME